MRLLPALMVLALLGPRAHADDATEDEPVCGNDVVEGDEECDDGNARDHDGCDAECRTEPLWGCGNAILGPAIECDDDGEACMTTCQIDSLTAARRR